MSRLECDSCGDLVDVSWRTTTLPYICVRCEKDSALALDQDGWETEYVDPACQQAAEEIHSLYIEEDDFPCDDATTYYIIEARGKFKSYDWFRSQNPDTEGVFDDYSTALEAAEREQDGSTLEYRVVEYRPESTPCDAPYNSGVPCQSALDNLPPRTRCCFDPPCQSALDSVQEEQYLDPYCVGKTDPRVHAMHSGDILDLFNADTELINGLTTENDDLKMKLSQANLNIQIQGEIIADLENTVGAYRVIFRIRAAKTPKLFPASHDSVAEENRRADALGMRRYDTMYEVDDAVKIGQLVPITGVKINDKLPKDRRYLRPEALSFLERLNRDVGSNLTVDSAIRPADVQRRLGRFNPNAAPFDGYRASSHERGSTFDISRRSLPVRNYRFLVARLLYYRAIGRILVIEEKSCYHVFVGEGNLDVISSPVGNLEQAPILIDYVADSGVGSE